MLDIPDHLVLHFQGRGSHEIPLQQRKTHAVRFKGRIVIDSMGQLCPKHSSPELVQTTGHWLMDASKAILVSFYI